MQAPTVPGHSKDVFGGACPSCFYTRHGYQCSRAVSHEDLISRPLTLMETGFEPTTPNSEQHTTSVGSAPHDNIPSQPLPNASAASLPPKQALQVSDSQHKLSHGSRAASAQNVPAGQDHSMAIPQVHSQSITVQKPSSTHRAHNGKVPQGVTTTNDARALPAGGQTMDPVFFEFQDMAWGLVLRGRELPLSEREALLVRVKGFLALASADPDVWKIVRRVSELPVERQPEVSQMMVNMLRQFLGLERG